MRRLVIATRATGDDVEAEPVLVDLVGDAVTLTLDDGETIAFDRHELTAAISDTAADRSEAA